jgi:ubiquinone/menaquinone biosynthesis C-methylase UbiE
MDTPKGILEYNKSVREKGLVKKYVENTDEAPVVSLCRATGLSDKDILDVGCATGAMASVLHAETRNSGLWRFYTGVDVDPAYLREFANRGIPNSGTKIGSATKLPVEDSSKDIVLFLFVLQHLSKQDGCVAIAELKRVARAGASVIIAATVHPTENTKEWLYAAEELVSAGAPEIHTTTWNKDELIDLVNTNALPIVDSEEVSGRKPLIKLYLRAIAKN